MPIFWKKVRLQPLLFRKNIGILKIPIFRPKSKAISLAFAFSRKYSDSENAYFWLKVRLYILKMPILLAKK